MSLQNNFSREPIFKPYFSTSQTAHFKSNQYSDLNQKYKEHRRSKIIPKSEDPQIYRNTISELIYRIRQKHNCQQLRQLVINIDKLEQFNLQKMVRLNSELQKNSEISLYLAEIDKLISNMNNNFLEILKDTNEIRLQSLFAKFRYIVSKLNNIYPETIASESPNGHKHLRVTDLLKQEERRRKQSEMNMNLLYEGAKSTLFQKQSKIKQLQGQNQKLNEILKQLIVQLEEKQKNLEECMENLSKLKKSMYNIKQQREEADTKKQLVNQIQQSVSEAVEKVLNTSKLNSSKKLQQFRKYKLSNSNHQNKKLKNNKQSIDTDLLLQSLLMQSLTIQQFIENHY